MSAPLYSLLITAVGKYVSASLEEQRLILFSDIISADIAMYCAVHQASELTAKILSGQIMKLNDAIYLVTAVGDVATENLKQLGHITLSFDGAVVAELPGTVHLSGTPPRNIQPGDRISFYEALN
ncbi:TPA: PTS glucitol/sorbitol transporter subunit IIA [Salmonella enterica subsp. salamae serovar 30:g,m,s:e,n,x]|nr:PTS glucitol/sorbitol transporter subunit IIA [Salmonella enterica subsp. salamae serovar 30:g,m,s:e,n,x]